MVTRVAMACSIGGLLAAPAKYEAEYTTSETRRWVALDVPYAPGVCAGRTDGDWQNIVRRRSCPSSPARSLRWGAGGGHNGPVSNGSETFHGRGQVSCPAYAPDGCHCDRRP